MMIADDARHSASARSWRHRARPRRSRHDVLGLAMLTGEWGEEARLFYRTQLTTELAVATGSGAAHRMLLYRVFRFASVCK
jgi:hypothetical protein